MAVERDLMLQVAMYGVVFQSYTDKVRMMLVLSSTHIMVSETCVQSHCRHRLVGV